MTDPVKGTAPKFPCFAVWCPDCGERDELNVPEGAFSNRSEMVWDCQRCKTETLMLALRHQRIPDKPRPADSLGAAMREDYEERTPLAIKTVRAAVREGVLDALAEIVNVIGIVGTVEDDVEVLAGWARKRRGCGE